MILILWHFYPFNKAGPVGKISRTGTRTVTVNPEYPQEGFGGNSSIRFRHSEPHSCQEKDKTVCPFRQKGTLIFCLLPFFPLCCSCYCFSACFFSPGAVTPPIKIGNGPRSSEATNAYGSLASRGRDQQSRKGSATEDGLVHILSMGHRIQTLYYDKTSKIVSWADRFELLWVEFGWILGVEGGGGGVICVVRSWLCPSVCP